jgi:hypothetical protein
MNDTQHPGNAEASALEAAFGGRWNVWLSDTGSWWAARTELSTAAERAAGCVHYLRADTPGELRLFIEDQEHLRAAARQRHAPAHRNHAAPGTDTHTGGPP